MKFMKLTTGRVNRANEEGIDGGVDICLDQSCLSLRYPYKSTSIREIRMNTEASAPPSNNILASNQKFCQACGNVMHVSATVCPKCGAPQAMAQASSADSLPPGVSGWSWGAFWLSLIWAVFNNVWIGLLMLIPVVNFVMLIMLGLKGREWAWKNGKWLSVEHFNRVQKKWDMAGWICFLIALFAGFVSMGDSKTDRSASAAKSDVQSEQARQEINALPTVTARELAAAYEENTVAADQRFKDKQFKVSGVVASIDTDITDTPYITLSTGGLMDPQFEFAESDKNQLASLKPGARVTLVCVGQGDIAKVPMSNSCSFVNDSPSSGSNATPAPPPPTPAAAQTASPYPMPHLIFNPSDLLGAMKRAKVDEQWYKDIDSYLNRPTDFWSSCVEERASVASNNGGYDKKDAQAWGEEACKTRTNQFHDCLNDKSSNDAALCLKGVTDEALQED